MENPEKTYVPRFEPNKDCVISLAPVDCPQCGSFGVIYKHPEPDVCFQCGWTGDCGWRPPKDFPRHRYVQIKPEK